ncbi:endonuclease/exonuclease/phosphatase family protein [Streptomyces sp. NBC_01381]|uniref:endonuclease/exonuclease/phosphatase family protein n=1 Tax=Streptomyces sp. NBC_01381 TaxID=2903845 RepID=UPI00225179DF|nr:endonuclease/exonuclease/phosphatase family protein [Streptomyces sp. NBC_01381]MCX4668007.1 endonuclease/exonuclease/phosphatase family protein [Streptomyces sp. NBC_01381]
MLLGTWNLENLYRPGGRFGPKDKAAYEAKLASLAATIRALRPSVLGVQEVGDPEALRDLAEMLGERWEVTLSEHADDRGIRVGFLSNLPVSVVADEDCFPGPMRPVQVDDSGRPVARAGRGVLAVLVSTRAFFFEAAVCHLKSKLLSYPGGRFQPEDEGERARFGAYALYRRAAEATVVRSLADRMLHGDGREHQVVVLGDLNDEVSAATTQILLGPPGSEIGTPGFDKPDKGDARRLWNVAPLIPAEQRYSRIHAGRRELIDHVLVSKSLLDLVTTAGTGVPGSAATALPSIGDDENPAARRDAPGSDHAPVWIRIER